MLSFLYSGIALGVRRASKAVVTESIRDGISLFLCPMSRLSTSLDLFVLTPQAVVATLKSNTTSSLENLIAEVRVSFDMAFACLRPIL